MKSSWWPFAKQRNVKNVKKSAWWLFTKHMTMFVECEDDKIVKAPPMVRRFVGKNIGRLKKWMKRQPGYRELPGKVATSEDT